MLVSMTETDAREYLLRFAVCNLAGNRVELMHFRNPHDCGQRIILTRREADDLALALTNRGGHFIYRDDAPDLQLRLAFEESDGDRRTGSPEIRGRLSAPAASEVGSRQERAAA